MSGELKPSRDFDALVIGGGVSGLTAGAYLAQGGVRVCVLEASDIFGGETETVDIGDGFRVSFTEDSSYALDPQVVRDLALHRLGLRYAERDRSLVALRPGGRPIVLPRETFASRVAISEFSPRDAQAWSAFRRETFGLARRLRPFWTQAGVAHTQGLASADNVARTLRLSSADAERLDAISRMSVVAYLDRWFETDALKAALALDVAISGASPHEPGSALVLLWRYAQESCGLQGAASQIRGGPGALTYALAQAARDGGAALRGNARVRSILAEGGHVTGIVLQDGEVMHAPVVLSSLAASATLYGLLSPDALPLDIAMPPTAPALTTAKLFLALSGVPPFTGLDGAALRGRLIVAERPESAAEAKGAALRGEIPREMVLETTIPSAADDSAAPSGEHILSVRAHFLPRKVYPDWAAHADGFGRTVVSALENYAPGLRERIVDRRVVTPDELAARLGEDIFVSPSPQRLLTSYASRIGTRIEGLYLCGKGAEPVPVSAARAARIATQTVLSLRASARRERAA